MVATMTCHPHKTYVFLHAKKMCASVRPSVDSFEATAFQIPIKNALDHIISIV